MAPFMIKDTTNQQTLGITIITANKSDHA